MLPSLRAALVALLVAPALAVSAMPASASPTPAPAPPAVTTEAPAVAAKSLSGGKSYTVTVTSGQAEYVRTATKLLRYGRSGTHLDWRKAKSYWGKHTTTRDQFVSGWVKAGGKLDNAAQSTITRLKNYPSGLARVANPNAAKRAPNCKGETKVTHPNSSTEDHYYDSCRTTDIIDHFDTCARWGGSVAFFTKAWKPAGTVAVLLIAACNQGSGSIKTARDKSDLGAFVWRTTTFKSAYGGYQAIATLYPQ